MGEGGETYSPASTPCFSHPSLTRFCGLERPDEQAEYGFTMRRNTNNASSVLRAYHHIDHAVRGALAAVGYPFIHRLRRQRKRASPPHRSALMRKLVSEEVRAGMVSAKIVYL